MEEIYKRILETLSEGKRAALATVVAKKGSTPAPVGAKMLVMQDGSIIGTVGGGGTEAKARQKAIEAIESNHSELAFFELTSDDSICGGSVDIFIEPIAPSEKLFIFGAGHIAQPLSKMASMTGFKVVIIDDRKENANEDRFPEADKLVVSEFADAFRELEIDSSSYIVIVTRGHGFDAVVLEWACGTKAKYIGMIGSKSKVSQIFGDLERKGISKDRLSEVHSPIGLAIGSETPSEIAVSILAEMIKIRRGKN